jgi:hypothetical protein
LSHALTHNLLQHRDSPVARVVEVKRLLDALLLREPGDHREYDREAEAGGVIKEEGREAGAGVAAEQGSGGGDSEHKPKKKRVKAE